MTGARSSSTPLQIAADNLIFHRDQTMMTNHYFLLASILGISQALTLSSVANTAVDAGAALALAGGPVLIPQLAQGYDAMKTKYEGVPDGALFDTTGWRGIFPEYDVSVPSPAFRHNSSSLRARQHLYPRRTFKPRSSPRSSSSSGRSSRPESSSTATTTTSSP